MSIAHAAVTPLEAESEVPLRRVRHRAREAATVMAFSAATSVGVAAVFLLLAAVARQA
ncbi:MAG: hypothetical protein H6529_06370 [Nocardioides sp.]|nr:hypothetical protein [Nocardioidaceae bacterium]MCB8956092.1 hypothetical protein [Nocardioides sp.]